MSGIENRQGTVSLINKVIADDIDLNTARGIIEGRKSLNAIGRVKNVGVDEVVISGANPYAGMLTTPDYLRIKAGGSINDIVGGTGATRVWLYGLDENWKLRLESVETNGSGASSSTSVKFIRLFTAVASNSGTYSNGLTGSNEEDIKIETNGGVLIECISKNKGITQSSTRCIPAGYTGHIVALSGQVDGDKIGTINMWKRENADIVSGDMSGRVLLGDIPNISGREKGNLKTFPILQEKTDVWATAVKNSGGTTSAGVDYQLILIKK
jgi:hypothetical protein